jgi:hypothetical protein
VTTDDGPAEIWLFGLVVQDRTTVRTGPDDDIVQVMDSTFLGLVTFDGRGGTDTFQDLGGNDFASPPSLLDFEIVV